VLYDWNIDCLLAKLVADRDELAELVRDVITPDWHFQHDLGRPFADTSAELIDRHPRFESAIRAWGPRFLETIPGMLPGMQSIVDALDARGVPLYAITNFSDEFWPPFREREAAIFDRFAGIVVSGAERLVKPDPAIYQLALERFGLDPAETLFVDDREDNIGGAQALGIAGHHFRDAPALEADLAARGLL
jgi:2-haloacid dehalogenase